MLFWLCLIMSIYFLLTIKKLILIECELETIEKFLKNLHELTKLQLKQNELFYELLENIDKKTKK